ncbi:hypothetical protein ACMD2_16555 [Ananas comosus]|uniref:Myb-like domain-containing protein n=1 Tax=Ananas comosus TaxID=4615 RepID=A0A199VLT2_ANACO|nr:hypothetical protein ACMD2_16555 [Ananas comosus]
MISLNALLAWNLVANTLTGREDVDPSILAEALRNVVALASLDERRGGVRFLRSGMRPMPRPPVDASVPSTGASCAPSHSDLCNVVEAAGSKESSGGIRCLHSEIPSTSRPPINASGPCAEAPRSNPSEVGNLGNMGEDRLEKYRRDIGQFILQERAYVPKVTLDQVKESILEGKYPALFSFLKHSGPVRRRDQDDLLPSNFYVDQERLKRLKFSTCDYGKKISQEDPSGFVEHNQHVTDSDGTAHLQMDDVGVEGNTIQSSERNGDTLKPPDKKITNLDGGKRRLSAQTAAALFPIDCTQILQRDVSMPQSNSTIRPNLPLNEHGSLIPTRTEKDQHPSNIIVIPDSASDDDAEDTGYTPDDDEMLAAEKHCLLSSQANNNQDSIAGDWTEQCWCMECDEGDQLLTCSLCLKAFRESCLGSVRFNEEGLFYCCFCTHGRADLGCRKARKSVLQAKENLSTGRCKDICKRRTGQARVVENVNYWLDDLSLQHRTGGLNRSSLRAEHHEHMEVTDFPRQVEKEVCVGRCDDSTKVEKVNDGQIVDKATTTVEGADTTSMNEQAKDLQPTEHHTPVGNGNFPCEEANASHSASVNEQVEDLQPTESHTAVDNSNLPCEQGKLSHAASANEQGEDFQPTEHHTAVDNSSLPCEEGKSSHRELDAGVVKQKGEVSVGGDHRNIQEPDSDEQVKEAYEDTDNEALPSRNSGRHCKRAQDASTKIVDQKRFKSSTGKRRKHAYQAKRSNPLMPPGRRTKLLWTMEEEAALKEGMQRFVSNYGGTIPWRAILEYGCGVFHKTRVPGDLKDKWRNIKIKEDLLQQSCV